MIWDTLGNIPLPQLLAFISGGLVLNAAPGQDVFFATASGIQGGPKAGALAGLGVGIGVLFHVTMTTLGLGAVIAAHPGALSAIRWIGAGYLLYLAWKAWTAPPPDPSARPVVRSRDVIRRGILSNVLNPKPVLFLLAFLPQFTSPAHGPVWHQLLGLGLIFAFTGTLITMAYGMAAGWLGMRLAGRMGILNRIAAVMFAGLAVRLVAR
ncbi:LysE family translocator [Paracoccus salipaludis]|uniref:Amino acid transporter n=1 Tax=Paracoccus salipaludis TaxID=2032623 RepID=A0A2A2GJ47_9RHOB|nr:LysE family translocator [Paracoccus salipaludis]PAU97014.1 amino acid transporter [Paracoccus salipaludis]